jgi:hypothetical protein
LKHEAAEKLLLAYEELKPDTNELTDEQAEKLDKLEGEYLKQFPQDKNFTTASQNATECLSKSENAHRQGFELDFEPYPGICTAYRLVEAGELEKAENVTKMILACWQRDGNDNSKDFWRSINTLEVMTIQGASDEQIDYWTKKSYLLATESWMMGSARGVMERCAEKLKRQGKDASRFEKSIAKIDEVTKLDKADIKIEEQAFVGKNEVTTAVIKASYNYKGFATNFTGGHAISGNFQFGGQLPDHCLTRSDWKEFDQVMQTQLSDFLSEDELEHVSGTQSLYDIEDVNTFLSMTDKIVRKQFSTDELDLEDLKSDGHKVYDATVNGLIALCASEDKKNSNSSTNISVSFGLGLGDCRHHAQVKQILFEGWQRARVNKHMRSAFESLQIGNQNQFEKEMAAVDEINQVELRTFDVVVSGNIKTEGKYNVVKKNGLPVVSDDIEPIEDHTMTFIIRKDKQGNIEDMQYCDSFYQHEYEWGSGQVPMSEVSIDAEGKLTLPGKKVKAVDATTNHEIYVDINLQPTPYAGQRETTVLDEHGEKLLVGLPVQKDFSLVELMKHDNKKVVQNNLENIRSFGGNPDSYKPLIVENSGDITSSDKFNPHTHRVDLKFMGAPKV